MDLTYRTSKELTVASNWQIVQCTSAIDKYCKKAIVKKRMFRKLNRKDDLLLMQPYALKELSRIICPHFSSSARMFTIVCSRWDFNFDDWEQFEKKARLVKKRVKEWLVGYDYIARVCIEVYLLQDGSKLVSPHVHGIFFQEPSKRAKEKISKAIKEYHEDASRPFVVSSKRPLMDAVLYAFKAPFGGKSRRETGKNIQKKFDLKTMYDLLQRMKTTTLLDYSFAGGKGRRALREIKEKALQH